MIRSKVRHFIVQNFLYGDDNGLSDEDSLREKGIVDSTGIVELLAFVETEFSFHVADAEITRDNFDSIAKFSTYIERKIQDNQNQG